MALLILGAGGFAREVAHVICNMVKSNGDPIELEQRALFFLDDQEYKYQDRFLKIFNTSYDCLLVGSIDNFDSGVLYDYKELDRLRHQFLPAVGSPSVKMSLVERAYKKGWSPFRSIRHSQSFVGDAHIDVGSIICSMCSITTNVKIGRFVNVNLNCTIGHDVIIEDYVNLSPHCTISGRVHIKKGADLGSAVSVLPGVTIGENSIIGAGAVVTKDIPDNCVAVGIPAKVIKQNA